MSPMWLTSKTPTPVRTAMCSAIRAEYSTGMSQPPKSTIFAPHAAMHDVEGGLAEAQQKRG